MTHHIAGSPRVRSPETRSPYTTQRQESRDRGDDEKKHAGAAAELAKRRRAEDGSDQRMARQGKRHKIDRPTGVRLPTHSQSARTPCKTSRLRPEPSIHKALLKACLAMLA